MTVPLLESSTIRRSVLLLVLLTFNEQYHVLSDFFKSGTHMKQSSTGVIAVISTINCMKANGALTHDRNRSWSVD